MMLIISIILYNPQYHAPSCYLAAMRFDPDRIRIDSWIARHCLVCKQTLKHTSSISDVCCSYPTARHINCFKSIKVDLIQVKLKIKMMFACVCVCVCKDKMADLLIDM